MAQSSQEKIVIVGFGWVGQANALALSGAGYDVSFFDVMQPQFRYADKYASRYGAIEKLKEISEIDGPNTWYIVSVGDRVGPDGEQDITNIRKALESLKKVKGGIILRSTVLPGHLSSLNFHYYVPEFLHEKKAVEECMMPQYFVLGKRGNLDREPSFFDVWRRSSTKNFVGTPEEASYLKYLSNIWNAMRIAFVNEFGNAIGTPSSKEELARIEKLVDFFFERKSYLRYGRSYGGHCLPKDTHAFLTWHKKNGRDMSLLSGIHESNKSHKKVEEKYSHLPEWFSEWVRPVISGRVALAALGASTVRKTKKLLGFEKKKTEGKR